MDIFNQTPFRFATMAARLDYPGHSLTLIVKGTFDLVPDGVATPVEEQPYPCGDLPFEDDEEGVGAPRYSSDFVPDKPQADLLVVGTCHSPGRSAISKCEVGVSIGRHKRSLVVHGDRQWEKKLLHTIASGAQPFKSIELRYERSFGGPGFDANPVGTGYADKKSKAEVRLPNLESARHPIAKHNDTPAPAGFGPLPRTWGLRASKSGTYDDAWLERRWPWFPEDFDPSHFNAAPEEMQLDGFLQGDEDLTLENLHPEYERYRSKLPGQRIRCFVATLTADDNTEFGEVQMNLDTLWVDAEQEQLVLVWRGSMSVMSEDFEEVQHILIADEELSDTPHAEEHYRAELATQLADENAEWEEEQPEPAMDSPSDAAPEAESAPEDEEHEKAVAILDKQVAERLAAAGVDPNNPPLPTPEQEKEQTKFLKLFAEQEQEAEEPPSEEPEPGVAPEFTRETVRNRAAEGPPLIGEDLRGLDLSGLDLEGADLSGCLLSEANLSGAKLHKADLSHANLDAADLTGADLTEASLVGADFTSARMESARLSRANAADAVFEGSVLKGAALDGIQAKSAIFASADLSTAVLKEGNFEEADFSSSRLDNADLRDACLKSANASSASGVGVDMSGADLTGLRASRGCDFSDGKFVDAVSPDSIWEDAKLDRAVFAGARMEGADFTSASLEDADFETCDLKSARFMKAFLVAAVLRQANLFEGNFERANLKRADFRGSNLFSAGFLDAVTEKARFEGANLKHTLLEE